MSVRADAEGRHPLEGTVTALLLVAMLVFSYTVVIGILNGVDAVEFERKALLSHVHAGTLGWITTGIFAASLWLFGASDTSEKAKRSAKVHAGMAIVTLPAFAFAFAFTYGTPRAILGTLALLTILAFCGWTFRRVRSVQMTTPHLGFLVALVTSVIGGVLGVMLATEIAKGWDMGPSTLDAAHPATMVVGFLTPVGMALAEWGLKGGNLDRLSRIGVIQIAFPAVGSVLLMVGILGEITPLPPIAALANLVGIGILAWRMRAPLRSTQWLAPTPARFATASMAALVLGTLYLNYLAGRYEGDFDLVPFNQLLALDHTMFIGVLTNGIFVLLLVISGAAQRFPRLNQVTFFGINAGLILFVAGLLAEADPLKHLGTPIMGLSILFGMAVCALVLLQGTAGTSSETSAEGQPASGA